MENQTWKYNFLDLFHAHPESKSQKPEKQEKNWDEISYAQGHGYNGY